MGSGLILLGIVGAWLAVLVPMALRRHDTSLGSVDRFHDAMRVLSRRDARQERAAARVDVVAEPEPAPTRRLHLPTRRERKPLTAAQRRRRLLLVLVVLAVATLVGAVVGPLWLLAPHLQVDLLLGGYLVHLRRTALARAERARRERRAAAARPAPAPAVEVPAQPAAPVLRPPVHVAGIPDRMPPRPQPLPVRYDEVPPARGAQGEAWSPVPVPTPTYLTAPAAPRRVMDLTRAGANDEDLAAAERELGIVDEGPQLDEILERRRAVND